MSEFKWHFAETGGGTQEGAEDPGLAFFKADPHHYIARETIQNSLDAKDPDKKGEPVTVEFKLFKAKTSEAIPELDKYKIILEKCIDSTSRMPSSRKIFTNALKKAENNTIDILSISDSGTVGIKDINKDEGRWNGLIKMIGKGSQDQRNIGGTFGIGKSAPFVCSDLRTVLYFTKNIQNESAFIWKSIFTTHDRPKRRGTGFYCSYSKDKSNEVFTNGIKNSKIRPSFIDRKHNGTDLFILGFKKPPKVKGKPYQPWNILLQRVILNNYFAALYDNELRVIITDENENRQYELNSNNVIEIMKKEYNIHKNDRDFISNFPFLDAYTNKDKIVNKGKIEGLGSCCFYIILKNDYKKRVSYMRKPKMMVYNKINPRLSTGYSALFMCESVNGNKFLSKLEGPTHSEWDSGYHNDEDKAKKIQRRISVFINEILKELTPKSYTTETIIGGLNQFTYVEDSDIPGEEGNQGNNENDEGDDSFELDDITIEMNDLDYKTPKPERKKTRKRKVKTEDGSDSGDEDGKGSGGREDDSGKGGTTPSDKGFGEQEGRKDGEYEMKKLPKSQYNYKCYQPKGSTKYILKIKTNNEKSCQIKFFADAVDAQKNEEIILSKAFDLEEKKSLIISENMINGVETSTNPKIIELDLKEDRKFGVEIELYA